MSAFYIAIDKAAGLGAGSPLDKIVQTVEDHEKRLRGTAENHLGPNRESGDLGKFLDQTFDRLNSRYPNRIEAETFKMVKGQVLAAHASNEAHIRKKIQTGFQNIQLELSLKAASKVSQGLQQILSSQ